jgi:HK97 gp10 family phage protein
MAQQGAQIKVEFTDLAPVRKALQQFPLEVQSAIVAKAVRAAIKPALAKLRSLVPVGPTGNLKAAVASKVKQYKKDGTAVGLVGYRAAGRAPSGSAAGGSVRVGKDRAFHQGFIEFGTKDRKAGPIASTSYTRKPYQRTSRKGVRHIVGAHPVSRQGGYINSSFRRLGSFAVDKSGQPKNNRVATSPRYPNAFFRKLSSPKPIPGTPVGGRARTPPVKTAFESTQGEMGAILDRELRVGIEAALQAIALVTNRPKG